MQETDNWRSELTFYREKMVISEEYSMADSKQTDFGLGVDAQTEDPLRPDWSAWLYSLWIVYSPQLWEAQSLKHLKDIEPFEAKN